MVKWYNTYLRPHNGLSERLCVINGVVRAVRSLIGVIYLQVSHRVNTDKHIVSDTLIL